MIIFSKYIIGGLFGLLFFFHGHSQDSFPDTWVGEYEGQMILANAGNPNDTVPVTFVLEELEKDSVWTYTMTYNSEKWGTIVKDYRYVALNKNNKTDFIFDELNGIEMELTFMNNCFYGMYEVMGNIYTTTFRKHGDYLFFELFAASTENPMITVTEPNEQGEDSIEAKSMKPTMVQSVLLSRKK